MRDDERRNLRNSRKGLTAQIWLAWLTPGVAMYGVMRLGPMLEDWFGYSGVFLLAAGLWFVLSGVVGFYASWLDEFYMVEVRELSWARVMKKSLLFMLFQIPMSLGIGLVILVSEMTVRSVVGG